MRMLDLFCGRGGWTNAFLDRGWECVGVDIVRHPDYRGIFIQANVLTLTEEYLSGFDFICASSPCEQFSVHGMKHFHPDPPYPSLGIALFEYTRHICKASGVPHVMENVRATQSFVGKADHRCGPFYLWGNAVPALMPQGINKGTGKTGPGGDGRRSQRESESARRLRFPATIPPELANCVAEYAERLLEESCKKAPPHLLTLDTAVDIVNGTGGNYA